MAKQTINLGSGDSRGDGESIRTAFDKCNDNFSELYTSVDNAFDGAYSSLTGKPTIPADVSDLTDTTNLLDHFSGNYNDLTNKPTIPTVPTTVSSFTNDAGYLTSFTETNDLSAAVTWANVPDANITESSVTQHQAALTITESQISDLQSYLTAISVTTDDYNSDYNLIFVPGSGNKTTVRVDSTGSLTWNPNTNVLTLDGETVTSTKVGQWNDAYGWGNHSSAGYLTSETFTSLAQDTTPQLGGNLDLNSSNITGTGDISITGSATFTDAAWSAFVIHETDNDTAGRFIALSGDVYVQAGAGGSGKATSSGNLRFSGYNNDNLNSLQAKFGNTFVDVATVSTSQTFTNKSGNISQWTNDSGYLTAVPADTTIDTLTVNDGIKEKLQSKSITGSGVFTFQCASGQIFYVSSPAANWTANFTDLTIDANYATTATIVIAQGATAYLPTAIAIAGSGATINWQGGSAPSGNANGIDVVTFSFLNVGGTYTVLGQLTDF